MKIIINIFKVLLPPVLLSSYSDPIGCIIIWWDAIRLTQFNACLNFLIIMMIDALEPSSEKQLLFSSCCPFIPNISIIIMNWMVLSVRHPGVPNKSCLLVIIISRSLRSFLPDVFWCILSLRFSSWTVCQHLFDCLTLVNKSRDPFRSSSLSLPSDLYFSAPLSVVCVCVCLFLFLLLNLMS